MPRVHFVKKARKDNRVVKAGESYYWWKPRYGGKRYSATYPKPSQVVSSAFLSEVYAIQEELVEISYPEELDELRERVSELREECEYSLGNMPEHLQETSTSGELLQARIDSLESWYDELDRIDIEIDEELTGEERDNRIEEILSEITATECPVAE